MLLRSAIGRLTRPLTGSLRTKLIAWFFVPTAIILVAVALVNFYSYQDVTEDLVIERDRDLTRLWSGQLATNLDRFPKVLSDVSHTLGISKQSAAAVQASLTGASPQLRIFDGGVILLDTFGSVAATHPIRPDIVGQDWSDRAHFRQMLRSPGPVFSDILYDGPQETEVIEVAVPIIGDQSEFLGSMVGVFHLRASSISTFYSGIVRLRIGNGSSYIVDGNGKVLYHDDPDQVGADFGKQQPVTQVLTGEVGAIRNRDQQGTDQLSAFAPIPGTPWGLVTEESWSSLTIGSRNTQRFLLLLLALGVAVPAIVVAIGLKRVMRPVEALKRAAKEVARGNFGQTIDVHSGDEIEELATEFNLMAEQLKGSYEQLEQRVVERTEELTASEERYRALFEDSNDAIFVSYDGKLVGINQAALDVFGFAREDAIGSPTADRYVDPADQIRFRAEIARTGSIRDFEVKLCKYDGTVMDCAITATLRRDADGSFTGEVQGAVRDMTERKQAELAVLEAEEKYRSIFENAVEGIYQSTPDGRPFTANPAMARMLGYDSPEQLLAMAPDAEHDLYVQPGHRQEFVRLMKENDAVSGFEAQVWRKDGTIIWISESARVARDENGRTLYYEGSFEDITERMQAAEAMRENAVLGERNRMAREIHDTLAQGLTGIVLQLEAAEQVMGDDSSAATDRLSRAKGLARESLQEARRSVWGLLPHALEQYSLDEALEKEVERFGTGGREKATFSRSGQQRDLPTDLQTVILRICQESLTNVRRHAHATEVQVSLEYRPREVHLSVQDDGAGFDPAEPGDGGDSRSFGLTGMEQRARQSQGSLKIKSEKGKGTVVEVNIPTA